MLLLRDVKLLFKNKMVLNNISLNVIKGECIGLIGSNGSGKTCLANIIVGLIKPNCGEIIFNGTNISKLEIFQRIEFGMGYLPQETILLNSISVFENFNLILELNNIKYKDALKITEQKLYEFGLLHLKNQIVKSLSGAEKRLVALAITLLFPKKLIIIDELFLGLDMSNIDKVIGIIQKTIVENNTAFIILDQHYEKVFNIADRILFLKNMKIYDKNS